MTAIEKFRIRRRVHPETRKVPARYVVHRSTRGNGRWESHPIDSPYCAVTHPGWTGDPNCGCLGTSYPSHAWARAVAEAVKHATEERLRFLAEMQARGRYTS